MMKYFYLLLLSALLSACSHQQINLPHERCLSAHESYSQLLQTCVRVSEVAPIRLQDKEALKYVLLSEDFQQAELFSAEMPNSILLEVVKGGYRSADGRYYLQRQADTWHLRENFPQIH